MGIASSVLQAVESSGSGKRFWTIDSSEFSGFISAVDGSASGIAGKSMRGWIYHLTAKSPSDMERLGFNNMGQAHLGSPPWK